MTDREFATDVVRQLTEAGFQALFAGGCVRDELLGLVPTDYDVATAARPEDVRRLFRRTVAVGESFGVVEVLGPRVDGHFLKVQVATFREDGDYADGRRPDSVTFSTAEADALRRDFTINGMFLDPLAGVVLDYVGGRADLEARVLRAIGEPTDRFREDKLRLLRAARFAARFGMSIHPPTAFAVARMAGQLKAVSAERVADELRKMLTHPTRGDAMRLLGMFGLLRPVFGDVEWSPEAGAVGHLPADTSFPLALAAVLPASRKGVAAVGRRLKLSNEERERAEWLADQRFALIGDVPMHTAKPLLAHPGADDLLTLHRADALAAGRDAGFVAEWVARRADWSARGVLDPPPLVTGDDLKVRGLEPGPLFKRLLDAARQAQLDEQATTHAEAMAFVERELAARG